VFTRDRLSVSARDFLPEHPPRTSGTESIPQHWPEPGIGPVEKPARNSRSPQNEILPPALGRIRDYRISCSSWAVLLLNGPPLRLKFGGPATSIVLKIKEIDPPAGEVGSARISPRKISCQHSAPPKISGASVSASAQPQFGTIRAIAVSPKGPRRPMVYDPKLWRRLELLRTARNRRRNGESRAFTKPERDRSSGGGKQR
jgi:hypothetical protein